MQTLRSPRFAAQLLSPRVRHAAAATPAPASAKTPATSSPFTEVKFVKENVAEVMNELPAFNFYEMKESIPNPYKGLTLDRSILLETPAPTLVPPKAEFSKLENGLKIASIDKQGMTASLGLFVNAGSRFEDSSNFGVSHMVSMMAYKSTAHLSHLRTVKVLEQLGCNATSKCKAGSEEVVYSVECMREFMPLVIPTIIGNVLFPRLLPWEVKSMHKQVAVVRQELENNADTMVGEMLRKAAYCNNTLGFSNFASDRSMSYFTPETIRSFMLDHFAPERMVLVGVNVEHKELAKWAMRSFADYNAIPLKTRAEVKAAYTGGELRIESSSPFCHLAIGLESVAWGRAELAPVTLLQTILGSGTAVPTGLGAGQLSRLSSQVVRQNPYVESCAAFNTSYSDSGLFGIYGVCQPDKSGELAAAIAKALTGMKSVSKDELAVAKSVLKASLARQLDEPSVLMQDLGQQILLSGKYGSFSDFAATIDGVTEAQVAAAASKLLSSKPTVVAFGDTHAVPHLAAVETMLKA